MTIQLSLGTNFSLDYKQLSALSLNYRTVKRKRKILKAKGRQTQQTEQNEVKLKLKRGNINGTRQKYVK